MIESNFNGQIWTIDFGKIYKCKHTFNRSFGEYMHGCIVWYQNLKIYYLVLCNLRFVNSFKSFGNIVCLLYDSATNQSLHVHCLFNSLKKCMLFQDYSFGVICKLVVVVNRLFNCLWMHNTLLGIGLFQCCLTFGFKKYIWSWF
jgi:hypothetical protein